MEMSLGSQLGRYNDYIHPKEIFVADLQEPNSYLEAENSTNAAEWREAMQE